MARPTRPLLSGAVYHVTARGNRRAIMFVDELDHQIWLKTLQETVDRFDLLVYTLCLMPNHYHLLVQTRHANLSAAMHHLNSKYAQKFNWRHALTGHVLQGRFHSVLIEEQEHLIELLRYIVLNPVRAKLVERVDHWRWSTFLHICGLKRAPAWLNTSWVLGLFDGATSADQVNAYRAFVDAPSVFDQIPSTTRHRSRPAADYATIPSLVELQQTYPHRNDAVRAAWESGAYTREQIARHFGVSPRTISRATRTGTPGS